MILGVKTGGNCGKTRRIVAKTRARGSAFSIVCVSQGVYTRFGYRDGRVSRHAVFVKTERVSHRDVVLKGLIGDSRREIVMPDSVRWQSGVFGCFSEVMSDTLALREFFIVCRDISTFKDRSPFPAARIFMNSGEKPTPENCRFQRFYLWRVA